MNLRWLKYRFSPLSKKWDIFHFFSANCVISCHFQFYQYRYINTRPSRTFPFCFFYNPFQSIFGVLQNCSNHQKYVRIERTNHQSAAISPKAASRKFQVQTLVFLQKFVDFDVDRLFCPPVFNLQHLLLTTAATNTDMNVAKHKNTSQLGSFFKILFKPNNLTYTRLLRNKDEYPR